MITLIKTLKKYTSTSDPVLFYNNLVGDLGSNFRTIEKTINTIALTELITYTTADRPDPKNVKVGSMFFNTTTMIPNFSDGINWKDSAGNIV